MQEQTNNSMAIILVLGFGALIGTMNTTLFNVALPALMAYFHSDVVTVQWVSSGFLLAAGVITPAAAFLGGQLGYKRLLMLLVSASAVLSFIGGFCQNIQSLIFIRVLFGMTSGLLMPVTMAMLYMSVPPHKQATAAGIWGTTLIIGGALPTVLSGAIISFASWNWLFWFMTPFCVLMLILSMFFLPTDHSKEKPSIDGIGLLLTGVASFLLLFSFSNLSHWGFSLRFFVFTLIGVLVMAIYVKRSWGAKNPILNLNVLRYPRYVAAILFDAAGVIAMYMITFMMPLFLQNGLGYSAVMTGTIMLPCCIFTVLTMPIATKVLNNFGEKILALVGILIIVAGSMIFVRPWYGMPVLLLIIGLCIRAAGLAFMNLLNTNTCMAAVPKELSGHASSLYNWQKQLVGALTTSVAGNIVGMRLVASHAITPEQISSVYLSTSGLLFATSSIILLCLIPVAFKFFRGKNEMPKQA